MEDCGPFWAPGDMEPCGGMGVGVGGGGGGCMGGAEGCRRNMDADADLKG